MSNALTLTEQEVIDLGSELCEAGFHGELGFQSRANRDAVYNEAKRRGAGGITMLRSKIGNQFIDPRYTVEGRRLPDKGLANDTIVTNIYFIKRVF
jgi:hypothetical protein